VFLGATALEAAPPEPNVDTHPLNITAKTQIPVHVYRQVDLSADDQRVSLDVATEVFSTASVEIVWTICEAGRCLTPSAADALKVRIVRSPDGNEPYSGVLGHALIDTQAGAGVLATVYIDRTRRLAQDLRIDYRILLGRAIAHELGHLLLGTSTHGSGLMREVWSHDELLGTRPDDWVLDPLDVAVIRERLIRGRSGSSRGAS
jgi:hypothetical protein